MSPSSGPSALEQVLVSAKDAGRKTFVPYLTGGYPGWTEMVEAAGTAGADAIEVGIPFSDPVMDGPQIQAATEVALKAGANPTSVLEGISRLDAGAPIAVMTYYNLVFRAGLERFAHDAVSNGVSGAILPDLPLDEAGEWCIAADAAGVDTVMLAAPTSTDQRLELICERSRGFVYAVGLLGVTGTRDALADSAKQIAKRLKAVTDKPVLVGVGVSTPSQAVELCEIADGVVVGSAIVRQMMTGEGPEGIAARVGEFREALDRG